MCPNIWEDLYQELALAVLETPDEKIQRIQNTNGARFYLVGILCNMVHSSKSRFYYNYKKPYIPQEYPEQSDYSILDNIEKLYWFDREIFKLYADKGSLRAVQKETGINYGTVNNIVKEVRKKLISVEPIKILLITTEQNDGLKYHRQVAPHARLVRTNSSEFEVTEMRGYTDPDGTKQEASIDSMSDEALQKFQIVYYLRQISFRPGKVQATIKRLHDLGIKAVLDIDDFWRLPSTHLMNELYKDKEVSKETEEALKHCDHIITTTDHFASYILPFNKNVTVLPNCINPDDSQWTPREIPSSKIRFGWIGGLYHKADIEAIEENFCKLAKDKQSKDRYQVCLGGYNVITTQHGRMPNPEYQAIETIMTCNYEFKHYDATYKNYLFTQTSTMEHITYDKSYRRLWARDVSGYGELYNEIDVALVPLVPNGFNKCKSELKIVEAGTMGKAVIVSDTEPYKKWIINGVNGIKVSPSRNNIDWYIAMRNLIKEPSRIKDLADGLKETIREHFDIDKHNKTRADLYKSLV